MFTPLKKIVNGFRLWYYTLKRVKSIDERLSSMERQLQALFDDKFGYEVSDGLVSQLGADFWVLHQNKFKRDGFFVEFGAYDGITMSNTLLLEKFGWKGICAEPNEELFKKLCTVRKCITTNDLIARESGIEYEFVACGPLGTILEHVNDDFHASVRNKYLKNAGSRKLLSLSLISWKNMLVHTLLII